MITEKDAADATTPPQRLPRSRRGRGDRRGHTAAQDVLRYQECEKTDTPSPTPGAWSPAPWPARFGAAVALDEHGDQVGAVVRVHTAASPYTWSAVGLPLAGTAPTRERRAAGTGSCPTAPSPRAGTGSPSARGSSTHDSARGNREYSTAVTRPFASKRSSSPIASFIWPSSCGGRFRSSILYAVLSSASAAPRKAPKS